MTMERQHETLSPGPTFGHDPFEGGTSQTERRVEIISGVYAHSLPLAGRTVEAIRREVTEHMNIAPDAVAVVDGHVASEDTVVTEGSVLNFVRRAGERG